MSAGASDGGAADAGGPLRFDGRTVVVTGAAYEAGVDAVSRIAVGAGPALTVDGALTPEDVRAGAALLTADALTIPELGAHDRPLTRRLAERAAELTDRP